jgi:hypothetical protein
MSMSSTTLSGAASGQLSIREGGDQGGYASRRCYTGGSTRIGFCGGPTDGFRAGSKGFVSFCVASSGFDFAVATCKAPDEPSRLNQPPRRERTRWRVENLPNPRLTQLVLTSGSALVYLIEVLALMEPKKRHQLGSHLYFSRER